jgi:PHD/YefM family antitoxin component YafN of YafNO toxin-antitoxin module
MKVITLKDFEANFDEILEDVAENKQYYRIQTEGGDFMLVPYEEYEVLKETYQEWVDEPTIDPAPLPIQYLGDAEPKLEI